METEEIKMLIELFNNVSDGAYTLLLIYISKLYISMILSFAIVGLIVISTFKLIRMLIAELPLIGRIKAIMGYNGELLVNDKKVIIETLKKGLKVK
ncbi:MAG: hypothetical protein GY804_02525 [Alphaproteobacteria bacterium]|nr:hypothetical protein [Alphaproteobacteria bacterium]